MIGYILLSLVKVLDNIVLTFKSITTYKEQKILSSILVVISQLIFYLVIDQVISDSTILSIIIVSVSSGIGNYIAFALNSKLKKDTKWTFVITSSNLDDVQKLCNYLAENNIKYIANDGYTRRGNHTINVIAFSKSKNESRLIEKFLATTESKYLKEII
jgi:uncharacterized protein YebE (UPF0316 family)